MKPAAFVTRARARMAEAMTNTVTVRRTTGAGAYNPTTRQWTPGAAQVTYVGPALVRRSSSTTSPSSTGEDGAVLETGYTVRLPIDADVQAGDAVTITAAELDPLLEGVTLWTLELTVDEWQVCRSARCSDQTPEVRP